ncbi:MAG TPA: hypothetical protein VM658_06465 [bacterium]|nr:hypothetical protein [bacterium]
MNFIANRVSARRRAEAEQRAALYSDAPSIPEQRLALQLDKFNACWREIQARVPFYKRLMEQGAAPARFDGWDQYLAALPVVDKSFVYKITSSFQTLPVRRISSGSPEGPPRARFSSRPGTRKSA